MIEDHLMMYADANSYFIYLYPQINNSLTR